ncbi:OmpA family protein [uncultured Sphingomonas sp.]|uniref:OmpA family protein n=1 Tax=uncultured Sphingomonas sp. TaxID=158754 RepID=UPI0025CF5311|nr:OmpA family protein [uncultured Sphingomonas sp.]
MKKINVAAMSMVALVAGCGHKSKADDTVAPPNLTAAASPTSPAAPSATPVAADFSIDNVPISNAPLGKFPYFGLPAGYMARNTQQLHDFGHFLFWTGKNLQNVEGQVYMAEIVNHDENKFSSYELTKNMEALFQQAGAVKVAQSKIPKEQMDAIPEATKGELLTGFGDPWNDPVETWVIRRPHDAIWIHYSTNTSQAGMTVVQTKPFVATAALLPVDQLKSDLDKTGKAVIHVNFATDQTQILPTSSPQINAVVALLKADPSLKLAINGYTDDTGSDAHNLTLSDGRAKAVQTALTTAGVKGDRLQAKGYGRTNPVSSNTDEEGKAANRRVELIKL